MSAKTVILLWFGVQLTAVMTSAAAIRATPRVASQDGPSSSDVTPRVVSQDGPSSGESLYRAWLKYRSDYRGPTAARQPPNAAKLYDAPVPVHRKNADRTRSPRLQRSTECTESSRPPCCKTGFSKMKKPYFYITKRTAVSSRPLCTRRRSAICTIRRRRTESTSPPPSTTQCRTETALPPSTARRAENTSRPTCTTGCSKINNPFFFVTLRVTKNPRTFCTNSRAPCTNPNKCDCCTCTKTY